MQPALNWTAVTIVQRGAQALSNKFQAWLAGACVMVHLVMHGTCQQYCPLLKRYAIQNNVLRGFPKKYAIG